MDERFGRFRQQQQYHRQEYNRKIVLFAVPVIVRDE
jgi:hypothetical protein